jgi:IS30 family transposase
MATKTKCYAHFSAHERDRLAVLHAEGKSRREIARLLRRSPSSVSREILRNARRHGYLARDAHDRAYSRKSAASRRPRLKSKRLRQYVEARLRERWSPELIAGRVPLDLANVSISHEAIYQWIYSQARHLIDFLPKVHRQRRRRGYVKGKHSKPRIPGRTPISERPPEVALRRVPGHWEVDTLGNHKTRRVLLVIHERKTRLTLLRLLVRRGSAEVRRGLIAALRPLPPSLRRSLTYDNGTENCDHLLVNRKLDTRSFFCAPFHSWEKGSIENSNGILRLVIPKNYNLNRLSHARLRRIERWINARPKKCLAFRSPGEIFKLLTRCKSGSKTIRSRHPAKRRRKIGGDRPAKE